MSVELAGSVRARVLRPPSRRSVIVAAAVVGSIVAAKLVLLVLAAVDVYRFSTPLPSVLLGAIIGLTYGLLAAGLVLIYRTNRIINFAHGQVGAFAAAIFGVLAVTYGLPYWAGFVLALAVGGLTGVAAEVGVVRRLRNAPRLVSVVATLGIAQLLVALSLVINSRRTGARFPQPSFLPVFNVGALRVTPAYSAMLFLGPVVVIAIALFLGYTRFGLGLRSAAANPEAARMSGIPAHRMSSLAWAIAGSLSAFTAILTQPTQGFTTVDTFGPSLLLRALACAVLAGMTSLPGALLAGVGLGIVEQLLLWNYPHGGLVEMVLFVIIVCALLVQHRGVGRDEEKGSWAAVQALRQLPERLRRSWVVRNLGVLTAVTALAAIVVLPAAVTNSTAVTLTAILAFSIVGLSIGILTGLGGQLTLGQFAVAAVGAVISVKVSSHTGNFPLALLYAGLGAATVSVLLGIPALRVRGLMLTVTTLAFALVMPTWLLQQSWALGGVGPGQAPGRPIVLGHALATGRSYYYFALAFFVGAFVVARNIRATGFGRLLVAIRDNEENARAFTVTATTVKLQAYALAGFMAGIGGAVYGHSLAAIGPTTFVVALSLTVVVMAVLGGISVTVGPVLGALYLIGLPAFVHLSAAALAATEFGALLVVLFLPAGLAAVATPVREWVARLLAARTAPDEADGSEEALAPAPGLTATTPSFSFDQLPRRRLPAQGLTVLEASGLYKHFGGAVAVDDVSLRVSAGETVGLIGPNGAGKTTTFELLSGFTRPDSGRVVFDQRDVSRLSPEERGRLGLIRSFQDAALFPTMTVTDVVKVALERVMPTRVLASVAGFGGGERSKARAAREIIGLTGLRPYEHAAIRELSTGTRRIVELACLVALQPAVLLLDEPSSGIAQRETEALGGLLLDLKAQLGLTLVVIEHDMPLVMGISDRMIAMADGRIIASGKPDDVRSDPVVIDAYLGGNVFAIERSGATSARGGR